MDLFHFRSIRARDLTAAREVLFIDPLMTLSTDRCTAMADEMFNHMEKRFEEMGRTNTRWFAVLTFMVTLIGTAATIGPFL